MLDGVSGFAGPGARPPSSSRRPVGLAFLAALARAFELRHDERAAGVAPPILDSAGASPLGAGAVPPAGVASAAAPPGVAPVAVALQPASNPAIPPAPVTVAAPRFATASADPFAAVLGNTVPAGAGSTGTPWNLSDYPRPVGDTGRGFDWVPTLHSDPAVVDRYVAKARQMGASWVVVLNDGANAGANDYLVQRLVANHIEPIVRIYTPNGQPISGDISAMVQHYVGLGAHYFVPYNEPNLPEENPDGQVSVDHYVDRWIPAARAIVAGGGLPGIGSLAPGAPTDDVSFLRATLQEVKQRGAGDLLDQGWISMHNYTFNRPVDYHADSNGFLKFRWYDEVARETLGRSLPVIGTEGGPRLGDAQDARYPAVDETRRDQIALDAFQYLPGREPYFFAQTQWLLANEAGGGHDPSWRADALFKPDGTPTNLAADLLKGGNA